MRDKLCTLVFEAIGQLNEALPPDARLVCAEHEVLSGEEAGLDSLGWVSLILFAEERIESALGLQVSLAEPLLLDAADGPPATVGDLADRLTQILEA